MRNRALCAGLLTSAIVLAGAPAAFAATATFAAGTLTVTGDATAETYTVALSGANIQVTGPTALPDPDGAGLDCTTLGTTVACADAVTNDTIVNALAGTDTLSFAGAPAGFNSNVRLNGGDDGDTLTKNDNGFGGFGFFGDVILDGGALGDTLNAGTGSLGTQDTGGAGNDSFNGSAQFSDGFLAEPGSDVYHGGTRVPTASETVDDPGTYQRSNAPDSISYNARGDALNVSLDNVSNDGSAGEADNVATDVENVTGGQAGDTLTAGSLSAGVSGGPGDDSITGGSADDALNGNAGSDSISGGAGDDFLDDGDFTNNVTPDPAPVPAGNDNLDGGAGNDRISTDRGSDIISGGAGRDDAEFSRVVPQAATVTTPNADVGFTISLDDVANDGPTGAIEDNVHSDIENVSTFGRAADSISGSAGTNVISTGGGNDSIDPGAGADIVNAGDGDDAVNAVDATTDTIDCGRGTDAANVDLAGAQPTRADVTFDCESISGQAFGAVQPVIDTSKPVLKLSSKTIKSRVFKRNSRLPIKVTCSKACSLVGEAFTFKARIRIVSLTGQFKVGSARLGLGAAGKARTLNVKVSKKYMKKYRRQLRTKAQRKRGLAFRVSVTASDALGIQASATRTIKVKG